MSLSKLLHIFRDIYDIFWRKSRFGFRNFRDLFILWNNFDFWKYYSFVNCSWCVFYASSKCQFLHHGGSVEVVRYKHFPWNGKPIQRRDYIKWAYFSMPISLFLRVNDDYDLHSTGYLSTEWPFYFRWYARGLHFIF